MGREGGRFVLFVGAAFLFLWLDLAIGHGGGGMKHPGMWVPVLYLPLAGALSLAAFVRGTSFYGRLFHIACAGSVVVGSIGFGFHLVRFLRVPGESIQLEVLLKLMRYPPLFAPLALCGLGVLGFLVDPRKGGS